ncbi:CAP domain-containing protein [Ruminococcus sp. NK3A76]|uniref:CAP domain-containing protein n=1 Tax=Ruminococcus sp. NK3A76 TaxID=877411 RepID=UPI000491D6BE|nr:CAP domain-containing protein [Ruminococcus sp. NK3A76]
MLKKLLSSALAAALIFGGAAALPEGTDILDDIGITHAKAYRTYTITKVGGGTISEFNNGNKCTIFVFGRPNCYNTRNTLAGLKNIAKEFPDVKVVFADIDQNTEQTVKAFADEFDFPEADFTYSTDDTIGDFMVSYIGYGSFTLPAVVINSETENLYVSTGYKDADVFLPFIEQCGVDTSSYFKKNYTDIPINVTYHQSEARKMLDIINSFRTGSQAWAWDSTDTKKVQYTGLNKLSYDYELEKVAMQRAAELVALYDHTRPNNKNCFSAYPSIYDNTGRGENIAMGSYFMDHDYTFMLWREDDYGYAGQGHRRNMLGDGYTAVGVACVEYKGATYWVQEFSSKVGSSTYTAPADSSKKVTVNIANSLIGEDELIADKSSISLYEGDSVSLPVVKRRMLLLGQTYWAEDIETDVSPTWKVTSGSAVSISDGKVKGLKAGSAKITASAQGKSVSVKVTVSHKYKDTVVKPTCTEGGYTLHTCSVCGNSYKDTETKTAGHKYTDKVVKPTYTSGGYTEHTCTVCGNSYKDSYTDKLTRTNISKAAVTGLSSKYYTGKAITQKPVVKLAGKTLKAGTDYTVSYKNNKAVGKATVVITGKGDYTGTVTASFKILPKKTTLKSVTSPKTKQMKVTYSKAAGVTGYQVTYSTSSKFTKATTKSVNVRGTSKTIGKLTKGKTYYVKVRTFKTVNGTKYYSGYSAVKKARIK